MQVALMVALWPEARAIARAFHLPHRVEWTNNFVENSQLRLMVVGPRATRLPATTGWRPSGVIMAGLAGALAPALAVGDVVIDGMHRPLPALGHRIHQGKIAMAAGIIATPAEKAALHRQTGALAVDMETETAREWAQVLGVPFLAVRAISDGARDILDPELLKLVDAEGRPRVGRAIGQVLRSPTKLPAMVKIGRATTVALSHLGLTLHKLLDTGWPTKLSM